jgi:hypothetical protein
MEGEKPKWKRMGGKVGRMGNEIRFSGPHHRDGFQLDGGGNGGAPAPLK